MPELCLVPQARQQKTISSARLMGNFLVCVDSVGQPSCFSDWRKRQTIMQPTCGPALQGFRKSWRPEHGLAPRSRVGFGPVAAGRDRITACCKDPSCSCSSLWSSQDGTVPSVGTDTCRGDRS